MYIWILVIQSLVICAIRQCIYAIILMYHFMQ